MEYGLQMYSVRVIHAKTNGLCMVVESEGLDPTGIEEVGRCMTYLKGLDA